MAAQGLQYAALFPNSAAGTAAYGEDAETDTTRTMLHDYFALDVPLHKLCTNWAATDANFSRKTDGGRRFGGIRVLQQDPWETLISFAFRTTS